MESKKNALVGIVKHESKYSRVEPLIMSNPKYSVLSPVQAIGPINFFGG